MKKLSIVAVSTLLMSIPAFAETTHDNTSPVINQTTDLKAIFGDTENLKVAILTEQEMAETQGAKVPLNIGLGGLSRGGLNSISSSAGNSVGAKIGNKLGNLGNGKVGQTLGNYQSSVGGSIDKKALLTNALGGATLGATSYKVNTPKEKQTTTGLITSVATGAGGGAFTALPIGTVRSYVIGTSIGMVGENTANKYMIQK